MLAGGGAGKGAAGSVARASAARDEKRLTHNFCYLIGASHKVIMFCDRQCNTGHIYFLKCIAADQVRGNLSRNKNHRYRIHHRRAQPRNKIARPRPARRDYHPDLPARPRIPVRHMCPTLLMSRNYKSNRRIIQLIEQGQYHPARIAKHRIDTLVNKCLDGYLGA